MGKNKQIIVEDSYEESVPWSPCNLALKYTLITVFIGLAFLFMTVFIRYSDDRRETDSLAPSSSYQIEDDIKVEKVYHDTDFFTSIKDIFQSRKRREIQMINDDDNDKSSFFKYVPEATAGECKVSNSRSMPLTMKRTKRNTNRKNLNSDFMREKTIAEQELLKLQHQYLQCNKEAGPNAQEKCKSIFLKFTQFTKETNKKFHQFDNVNDVSTTTDAMIMKNNENKATNAAEQLSRLPYLTKNNQNVGQTYFGDGFNSYTYDRIPRFHEDLIDSYGDNPQRTLNTLHKTDSRNDAEFQQFHQPQSGTSEIKPNKEEQGKNVPAKVNGPTGASGPFLSLCDQISRQNSPNNFPIIPPTGVSYYNGPQFQTIHQFSGRGQNPITGEAAQSSAVVLQNPGYSFSTNPVCFYASQPVHPYRTPQQVITLQPQFVPQAGAYGELKKNHIEPRTYDKGFVYVPTTAGGIGSQIVQQGVAGQGTITRINQPTNQPMYCTYLPSALPKVFRPNHYRSGDDREEDDLLNDERNAYNIPSETDIIYASYANQLMAFTNRSIASMQDVCQKGYIGCFGSNQCILKSKWCDSNVDCIDSSDESACSCKSRLSVDKICDGYIDCPMGSDEIGCFGCDKFSYSCYNNANEYNEARQSHLMMCYNRNEKCDGFENCLNGRDEEECNMITRTVGEQLSYMVSYTEGYLHRNYRGVWYPVCENPLKWAKQACEAESGPLVGDPKLHYLSGSLPGPYISRPLKPTDLESELEPPQLTDSCPPRNNNKNIVLYVKCPPMRCGVPKVNEFNLGIKLRERHKRATTTRDQQIVGNDRIVGGDNVEPLKWPFIVGIYRSGKYHCGGIIQSESWIITAAHCVAKYYLFYYEVIAGILRRSSYSPMSQTVRVAYVVDHENYNRNDMINDIALLKLETPLVFNRWVKPICLPAPGRTASLGEGPNWIWGPAEGTICKTVGWGAIREKGPVPDELREVAVPIIGRCKHLKDREGEEICAGDKGGGRDACQGDSGGPLFCQSVGDPNEWYLAGIVSHGEGCARPDEPGVYTRLALYLDWIMMQKQMVLTKRPKQECPGHRCVWGGGLCISKSKRCNQIVDCLGGEDEIRCGLRSYMDDILGQNVTVDANDEDEGRKDMIEEVIDPVETVIDIEGKNEAPEHQPEHFPEHPLEQHPPKHTTEHPPTHPTEHFPEHPTEPFPEHPKEHFPEHTTEHQPKHTTEHPTEHPTEHQPEHTSLPPLKPTLPPHFTPPPPPHSTPTPPPHFTPPPPPPFTPPPPPHFTPPSPPQIIPPVKPPITFPGIHIPKPKPPHFPVPQLPPVNPPSTEQPPEHSPLPPFKPPPPVFEKPIPKPPVETTTPAHVPPHASDEFICTKIHQKINMENRCDMVTDCEDGTDEVGCSCVEYLKHKDANRICDGKVDCGDDLTDEEGCLTCPEEEYSCLMSKKCISKHLRCDDQFDCELKEDELDCFALSDGKTVELDVNLRPWMNFKGIVCKNSHGEWNIMCGDTINLHENGAETAGQICGILGFSGYSFFNLTKVPSDSIATKIIKRSHSNEIHSKFEQVGNAKECTALYVECVPHEKVIKPVTHLIPELKPPRPPAEGSHKPEQPIKPHKPILPITTDTPIPIPIKPINQPDQKPLAEDTKVPEKVPHTIEERHWPWSADIYVEGRIVCVGILLDNSWVLTESSCMNSVNLEFDYVVVVVGLSQAFMNITGAYEQIVRVSCMVKMDASNTVLLFMEHTVRFNRETLPTFLPERIDLSQSSECFALSHNKFGKMVTLPLVESEKQCFDGHSCYKNARQDNSVSDLHCDGDDITRCGAVVCSLSAFGYYPTGFYSSRRGLCAFKKIFPVPVLQGEYENFGYVIEHQSNYCMKTHPPPVCSGHRCLLGSCIKEDQICNGKFNCHDGSDEAEELCRQKECSFSDLKCDNGKCVSKTKFCDHVDDCGDLTDEPAECSCFTYYNVTDLSKICDGVRNCWDKSDENPAICSCRDNTFKCGSSNKCVPNDFVCDGERDCPSGEDEQFCFSLEYPTKAHDGYGQVIQQTYGIWHTKCFLKSHQPTEADVAALCNELGYRQNVSPSFRVISDNPAFARSSNKNSSGSKYRFGPTKAAVVNKFTPLRVNNELTLYVKPSRPIAKLVNWDKTDDEKCFRLEVRCE